MAVPFDVDRRRVTGPAVEVVRDVTASPSNGVAAFAIAGNGTLVYVPGGSCQVETELAWTDPDGAQEVIELPAAFYTGPFLSPDGTRASLRVLGTYDTLYVLHLERRTLTPVTFGVNASSGIWDRDGEHLFAQLTDPSGTIIVRLRADGTGEPEILHRMPPGVGSSLFEVVVVEGRRSLLGATEHEGLSLFSIDGPGEVTPLIDDPRAGWEASVSPDGRCLAYASTESGRSEVYVRPFPAGVGRTQVSATGGRRPLWSRDGGQLLYVPTESASGTSQRRFGVATQPGDCLTITDRTPKPMGAPSGERVLETRPVDARTRKLDAIAIQGWADTLRSSPEAGGL
jgi:hypothetical protein